MKIFEEILDIRSFTVIGWRIDETLPTMAEGPAKEALLKMQDTNQLDEIYALAHEQLGQHEEAAKLRQWLANQVNKPKPDLSYLLD